MKGTTSNFSLITVYEKVRAWLNALLFQYFSQAFSYGHSRTYAESQYLFIYKLYYIAL